MKSNEWCRKMVGIAANLIIYQNFLQVNGFEFCEVFFGILPIKRNKWLCISTSGIIAAAIYIPGHMWYN
jgi:hypothetical protein